MYNAYSEKKVISFQLFSDTGGNPKFIDNCFHDLMLNLNDKKPFRMSLLRLEGYKFDDNSKTIDFISRAAIQKLS